MKNDRLQKQNLKQLVIELDTDTLFKFKRIALEQRISMGEIVRNYITTEIEKSTKNKKWL